MNFNGYLQFADPVGIVKQTVCESQRFLGGSKRYFIRLA
jgi:hypothetical protein